VSGRGGRCALMLGVIAMVASTAASCAGVRERVCSEGEYPVWSVKYPETGRACVPSGERPARGYATYPPGLVPEYTDDEIVCSPDGDCKNGSLAITCPRSFPADPCSIAGRELPLPPQRANP
jgi:hypothetical protein